MKRHSIIERIVHKINSALDRILSPIRRSLLNNQNFTIISNNCWGGKVYEYFNIEKKSPTIGAYFFAEDYIKFIYNLKYYLGKDIKIIEAKDSKHREELKRRGQMDIPIGKIDDIEIIFLHYKDPKIAKEKFERRVKRINWNNLILKFSYMNNCTEEHLRKFDQIKGIKKILFVGENNNHYEDAYIVATGESGQIEDDTFYWKNNINIIKFLNQKETSIDDMVIKKE